LLQENAIPSYRISVTKDAIEISAQKEVEKEEKEKSFIHLAIGYSLIYKKLFFPDEVVPEKAGATVKQRKGC
jgi:HSP20 family molecular chaperone IbpA